MGDGRFNRRYFFYGSLLAGAVPVAGFGSQPSLTHLGYKSFNDKLNLAGIGMGIRGPAVLGNMTTENIIAVCDPDEKRAAQGFKRFEKATKYKDYRKLLDVEGKNIDGVMIATPDHLHTPIALAAMQLGKHVYCEKPLTRTVWEERILAEAAVKYKVATQMGNQGFSHEATKTACEIVWSGEIGDVTEVHAWTGAIYGGYPSSLPKTGAPAEPVPDTLDWDLYVGPAPKQDFNQIKANQWRSFIDFSTGGSLGDWMVHNCGAAHLALQLGKVAPTSVECVTVEGDIKGVWPLRAHLVFEFPARGSMPPVKVHVYQNMRGDWKAPEGIADNQLFPRANNLAEKGRDFMGSGDGTMLLSDSWGPDGKRIQQQRPPQQMQQRPAGAPPQQMPQQQRPPMPPGGAQSAANRAPGNGAVLVGSKGLMATVTRGEGVWLLPAARWAEYKLPNQILPRGVNHQQDWIRACKGGVAGVSDFSIATRYIEWLALGTVALQVPGKLQWDEKAMRFTNNNEANKYIKPYMRKGWEFKL